MASRNVAKISEGVYWVGIRDRNRRLFDALIPLPRGTSYNAYLITGGNKTALIDTVYPGFEKEFEENIRQIVDLSSIDYLVMNHAEPDHSGAIPYFMSINSKAVLLTNKMGAKIVEALHKVPQERIKIIADQETIDLGGRTLRFIETPMLHWPETMVTYLQEDKILFTGDIFGSHVAEGLYDDEVDDLVDYMKIYFGEIIMPLRLMAEKALVKMDCLDIRLIAPSHGPIHKNPKRTLDTYRKWARGETKRKVIMVYVTMYNSTEKMILQMAETLASEGVEIALYNLSSADIGEIAKDLVDSSAIVIGAPTVLGGVHPVAQNITSLVKTLRPPAKFGVILSSYAWGGGAVKHIQEILATSKLELVGAMEVQGPPSENNIKQIAEIGKALADKIKSYG